MYGTVARLKLKAGMGERLVAWGREQEEQRQIEGYLGSYLYQMDRDPNELYLVVLFKDREHYVANAQSPEQDEAFRQMVELLEGDPEWNDGTIVLTPSQGPLLS